MERLRVHPARYSGRVLFLCQLDGGGFFREPNKPIF
jgi:hypothetical protein